MSLVAKGFGQRPEGFVMPSLADVLEDTQEELDKGTGLTWRRDPAAVVGGQIAGVVAIARHEDWAQMENVYHSRDPRVATGAAHEAICALDQVHKHPATYSTGEVLISGDVDAEAFNADSFTSDDDRLRYGLSEGATLETATPHDTEEELELGAVRSSAGGIYVAVVAGTTGAASPPTGTGKLPTTYVDGTVEWAYVGLGLAFALAPMAAEEAGPVGGPAGSITKIGTPRAGIRGALNAEDVVVGRAAETDDELRVRRAASVIGRGKPTLDGIGAGLRELTETRNVRVFQNTLHTTSADGIPPHAVEPVLLGPSGSAVDQAWAENLHNHVAGGIHTHGTTSKQVADSYGIEHTMKLTRPGDVPVYARIVVRANRKVWPVGGGERAKAAVLGYGQAFEPGLNARYTAVEGSVWRAQIPGALGVKAMLSLAPIVGDIAQADIEINLRELAVFDTLRTDVFILFEDP